MRGWLRSEPWMGALVAFAVAVFAAFSLVRWAHFGANGFDLGIFDQTVWRYSRFEVPANSIRGFDNIWGDHFSPVLMLLAPLYWLWSDARMLLLAQAVALAAAAVPVFLYARPRLGRAGAYLLAGAYLAFWGLQAALNFDFHELAFVPLALGCALVAADRERWRAFAVAVLALLCVKEDQSIVAVFLGLWLLLRGHRRAGVATVAAGVAWYVLVVGLLIPHNNPSGAFAYWSYSQFGDGPLSAIAHAATHPGQVVRTLLENPAKRETLAFLFVPLLGLCLLSRTAILLVPLVAQRFLSETPAYWTTGNHYSLAVAVILFVGAADGLATLGRWVPRRAVVGLAAAVLALNAAFTVSFDRDYTGLADPGFYEAPAWVDGAEAAVAAVPDGVSVAAQDNLVPRLAHRELIAEITPEDTGPTDYVVASVIDRGSGHETNGGFAGISRYLLVYLQDYVPVAYHDGFVALRSKELPPAERTPALAPVDAKTGERLRRVSFAWGTALGTGDFSDEQAALEEALGSLPPLSPGCAELADAARTAAQLIGAADQTQLVALGEAQVAGYVGRFVELCTPTAQ